MLKPMKEDEARALLAERHVGRLGCVCDNEPYVVPISYIIEGDIIYIHSLMGKKIRALRSQPRACLQVDDIRDAYHWRSVIASGHYEEVWDSHERTRILDELLRHFPNLTPVEDVPVHDGQSSIIVFRIRIDRISGIVEQ
ncbi:MAG TPA: pyridoxamine 5'-phosphate oxidase family protein [Blastocatellia bacterium]|jgi:nitroimidazol reductase NimA-like FMN-containing flavoprotein (pyridoxamine 5'-phosphate oxidase superfamily)